MKEKIDLLWSGRDFEANNLVISTSFKEDIPTWNTSKSKIYMYWLTSFPRSEVSGIKAADCPSCCVSSKTLSLIFVTFRCTIMSFRLNTKKSKILNWSSIIVTLLFYFLPFDKLLLQPMHIEQKTIWFALEESLPTKKEHWHYSHFPNMDLCMPFFFFFQFQFEGLESGESSYY